MAKVISLRAQRVWDKLMNWYGTRLAETYGPKPPPDWIEVIDAADNDTIRNGLSAIRRDHLNYPPTFPQFAKIMKAHDSNELRAEHADAEAKTAWDKYFSFDAEEARLKLTLAKCSRIEATTHPSNPIYAEARAEAQAANKALLALWEKRRETRRHKAA